MSAVQRKPNPLYAQPPENRVGRFIWKWRMRLSSTFAMTMLEPWECAFLFVICLIVTITFWMSVYTYSPSHIAYLSRRFAYYVYDDETVDISRVFKEWIGAQFGKISHGIRGAAPGKEL